MMRADRPTFNILFICLGNMCRSPMAEGMAKDIVENRYPDYADVVQVSSAGTGALECEPASDEAVLSLVERRIDITAHRARRVNAGMLQASDLVLVMEERQRGHLVAAGPCEHVHLLLKLGEAAAEMLKAPEDIRATDSIAGRRDRLERVEARIDEEGLWRLPDRQYEVPDPMGLFIDGYREVREMLDNAVRDILEVLLGGNPTAH